MQNSREKNEVVSMQKIIAICHGIIQLYNDETRFFWNKPGKEGIKRKGEFILMAKGFYSAANPLDPAEFNLPKNSELVYEVTEYDALSKLYKFYKDNSTSSRLTQNVFLGLLKLLNFSINNANIEMFSQPVLLESIENTVYERIQEYKTSNLSKLGDQQHISLDDIENGKNSVEMRSLYQSK